MIYITLCQSSGGRSGHKLKDIMTVFIFSYFIQNSQVVYHPTWQKQSIISKFSDTRSEPTHYDKKLEYRKTCWGGISNKAFFELVDIINKEEAENPSRNILVTLYGAYRFHPFQLHNLYLTNSIKKDYFSENFIRTLKKSYFGDKLPKVANRVSIHIRRGDLAKKLIDKGMDNSYFLNIIKTVNSILNIPIFIYSEKVNSDDLLILKKEPNVRLFLGNSSSLKKDFYNMVTSKYLFISAGGFSTWSSYLSLGSVFYDKKFVYQYEHIENPKYISDFKIETLSTVFLDRVNKYITPFLKKCVSLHCKMNFNNGSVAWMPQANCCRLCITSNGASHGTRCKGIPV